MFPQAIGLAAMFDTELTQKAAEVTAEEARAKYNAYTKYGDRDIYKGLTFWAPNINIFREKIMLTGKPVVVVCAAGSAVNSECEPDALIHAWYPGPEGGTALARILFGDVSPSGKQPVTFYERSELLPDFTDYSMKNRTYRFAENNVLYPFGYGLTYGKIVCKAVEYADGKAAVTVENAGDSASEDVVQLYIKDYCEHAVPNVSLCGFQRVSLAAGETRRVEIPVAERTFTADDEDGKRSRFGSRFTLYAGTHQPDALSEKLCGTPCVSTEINF